jgi:phosphoribosylpyrophosphate synthetase
MLTLKTIFCKLYTKVGLMGILAFDLHFERVKQFFAWPKPKQSVQ